MYGIIESGNLNKISSIHASSAGGFSGAYGLAGQGDLGSSIYWQNLQKEFICWPYFFMGIFQRFCKRFFSFCWPSKIKNPIDIDRLINIVKNIKPLDTVALKSSFTPLYIKLFNLNTSKVEYVDIRHADAPLSILRGASCIVPYFYSSERIGDSEYIDASLFDPLGLDYLLERYPEHKIVVVINDPHYKKALFYFVRFLEGIVASWCYPKKNILRGFIKGMTQYYADLETARRSDRVLILKPPKDSLTLQCTIDPAKLKQTWEMGKKEAQKIIDFIEC